MSPSHEDGSGGPGLSLGGYFCPQCRGKYTELPVECKVCGRSGQPFPLHFFPPKEFCVYNKITSSDSCLCDVLSQRFDSGIGPPSGQILPPPVPSASLHRNGSGRNSRRQVTQFVFVNQRVQNTTICSKAQTPGSGHILATLAFVCLFFRKNDVINLCSRK